MLHERSRYKLTTQVSVIHPISGRPLQPPFMDIRQRVTKRAPDDQVVAIDSSRHWSHLSAQFLGDARNWWIVADLSGVIDTFAELVPGNALIVPSVQRFLFDVMAGDNR